jgi:thermitase
MKFQASSLIMVFATVIALTIFGVSFGPAASAQIATPAGNTVNRPDPVLESVRFQGLDVARGEILVQFKNQSAPTAGVHVLAETGSELIEEFAPRFQRIRFDDKMYTMDEILARFRENPNVEFAEPNLLYEMTATPNDPKFSQQWGPKKINCTFAWDLAIGNPDAVVAVIDSGIDMDHPDLQDQYAYGYDFYANDAIPQDQQGHGSHTSGTAAGGFNNGVGIAGVAAQCRFAAYRAGNKYLSNSAIVASINDARDKGALVISMSFGSGGQSTGIKNALANAYAAGVVCVASAGNNGNTNKNWPAADPNVIAVASSDTNDSRSGFSTYGSWVDVAAPGSNILSTYLNGKYATMSGTSMSCPHVAGMALLLYTLLDGGRSQANADIVRNTIQDTSVSVGNWVIHGRVDVASAVNTLAKVAVPVLASVSPVEVQGFGGETLTLKGTDLGSASQVISGGLVLERDADFTVIDAQTITYPAPAAPVLGPQNVTVINKAGTSNPAVFSYVKTDPIKLVVPFLSQTGADVSWRFGADANAQYMLLLAADNTTMPYRNLDVLMNFALIGAGQLNAGGTGLVETVVPAGFSAMSFFSQFITYGKSYVDATGVSITYVTF